jgi:hypothetical protein
MGPHASRAPHSLTAVVGLRPLWYLAASPKLEWYHRATTQLPNLEGATVPTTRLPKLKGHNRLSDPTPPSSNGARVPQPGSQRGREGANQAAVATAKGREGANQAAVATAKGREGANQAAVATAKGREGANQAALAASLAQLRPFTGWSGASKREVTGGDAGLILY